MEDNPFMHVLDKKEIEESLKVLRNLFWQLKTTFKSSLAWSSCSETEINYSLLDFVDGSSME